mgnify:CR=1 FL=1
MENTNKFSQYQIFVIAVLAILQFTIVLDFMVLSPLSAILLDELSLTTSQFGLVVSAYAFSAGASGLLAAGFADKFDRKKLLLFFYTGFIIGTLLCGIAPNYEFLLMARIVTGLFGGVIGSIIYAIITDLFDFSARGRVMGFVQMAFATSQILGMPFGIYLANHYGWHSPFILIVILSIIVIVALIIYLKPINEHLALQVKQNALKKMANTISNKTYLKGFMATTLLATGGFMLMPFGAAYSVNNLGISLDNLPLVYMVTGVFSMMSGPIAGKISDSVGKYKVFLFGCTLAIIAIIIYCNLGITPITWVIVLSVIMFIGITSRMVASQALMTAVPEPADRGTFMGINSSVMQIAGGIASSVAGLIVVQSETGQLENYPLLGYVVAGSIVITMIMMSIINKIVMQKNESTQPEMVNAR